MKNPQYYSQYIVQAQVRVGTFRTRCLFNSSRNRYSLFAAVMLVLLLLLLLLMVRMD